mmetsp:Transcript_43460/g.125459  ORF Transcript_43460/g.125459 Transcript_43460/m.125459 type:complete len:480 (+) Transcript_43460:357-1796(+)
MSGSLSSRKGSVGGPGPMPSEPSRPLGKASLTCGSKPTPRRKSQTPGRRPSRSWKPSFATRASRRLTSDGSAAIPPSMPCRASTAARYLPTGAASIATSASPQAASGPTSAKRRSPSSCARWRASSSASRAASALLARTSAAFLRASSAPAPQAFASAGLDPGPAREGKSAGVGGAAWLWLWRAAAASSASPEAPASSPSDGRGALSASDAPWPRAASRLCCPGSGLLTREAVLPCCTGPCRPRVFAFAGTQAAPALLSLLSDAAFRAAAPSAQAVPAIGGFGPGAPASDGKSEARGSFVSTCTLSASLCGPRSSGGASGLPDPAASATPTGLSKAGPACAPVGLSCCRACLASFSAFSRARASAARAASLWVRWRAASLSASARTFSSASLRARSRASSAWRAASALLARLSAAAFRASSAPWPQAEPDEDCLGLSAVGKDGKSEAEGSLAGSGSSCGGRRGGPASWSRASGLSALFC